MHARRQQPRLINIPQTKGLADAEQPIKRQSASTGEFSDGLLERFDAVAERTEQVKPLSRGGGAARA